MYEDEYYFIRKPLSSPHLPSLQPDQDTANRNYDFEVLPLGQAPLKFHNAWKEECRDKGIKTTVPDVMFDGTNLVVNNKIRERLFDLDLPNLSIYPAIYVDDQDAWHEDRWYLTFPERFDCWDRETSDYEKDVPPVRLGGEEYHQIYSFKFNSRLMSKTPLKERLLFKLGGSIDAYVVSHLSVVKKLFGEPGKNGAEYVRATDL
jgi:hypothetical protein